MESDRTYFLRRAAAERAAAISAAHPMARAAHLEMARRYEERLNELAAADGRPDLKLVDVA